MIFAFGISVILGVSVASAYNYTGQKWSGTSTNYYINTDLYNWGWASSIITADQSWDNAGSRFRFNYQTTTPRHVSVDGYNVVDWLYTTDGRVAITYTWPPLGLSNILTDVDTILNTRYSFSTAGEAGRYDIQNTMAHEFGHWLYLEHSTSWCGWEWEATMCASGNTGETRKRSLETDDKNGIKAIYGT